MATVVNLQKDERAGDLGKGVAGFLNRMADRRIDGLQQELMEGISSSKDEVEATALMADPRFQDVMTDNNRMGAIVTYFNNAPLGLDSISGYDTNGSQQIVSFREGTDPAQALKDSGLTLERSDLRFIINDSDPFSTPRQLGRFVSNTDAIESIDAELGVGEVVMGSEAMKIFMQNRELTQSSNVRQFSAELRQLQFEFDKNKPLTTFDAVQRAIDEKRLTAEEGKQAWDTVIFKAGLTDNDVALSTIEELEIEGAKITAFTAQSVFLADMALANPEILSLVGAIPKTINGIMAELNSATALLGLPQGTTIDESNFDNFSNKATAFKSMLLIHALSFARSEGQEGRGLNEPEFQRFHKAIGSGIVDANVFAGNMQSVIGFKQLEFRERYARLQRTDTGAYEREFGAFPSFSSKTTEEANELELILIEQEAGLPPGTISRQGGT